jgi:hypothetical protein
MPSRVALGHYSNISEIYEERKNCAIETVAKKSPSSF